MKMGIRDQNLEATGAVFATFSVKQTAGVDDLKDADIGKAVTLSDNYQAGSGTDGAVFLGKLIDLTLTDADNGKRVATVQVGGVMSLPIISTYPQVGNRVICGASGTVKQAPVLTDYDPAGGNIARGTVIAVNGTTDCTLILN
jgi:predicted RecA/RadA family phage recombinase